jgi:poly-gamma-glutamate capsule biosynthesis protein CapA/YwtB (metallophosphatase superfamily)
MKIIYRSGNFIFILVLLAGQVGFKPLPRPVQLALLGDVMLGRWVGEALCHNRRDACEWPAAFSALEPVLRRADLVLANLESPLTTVLMVRENYDLRANPKSVQALADAGFDLVSLANNHIMDCGTPGLGETRAALKSANIQAVGPEMEPTWRTVGNLRIAFLAFQDVRPRIYLAAATEAVRQARKRTSLVIVSIHWGSEYQSEQNNRQKEIAQALADAGATLIWGHHPHVLQPVAWIQGAGQPSRTLVSYSLGNALFDQMMFPDTQQSAVLLITLDQKGVQRAEALPFEIDGLHGRVKSASIRTTEQVLNRLQIPRLFFYSRLTD